MNQGIYGALSQGMCNSLFPRTYITATKTTTCKCSFAKKYCSCHEMLVVQALLLLALQSEGVYMAPIVGETDPMTCKDPIQCELDQILEEALLNETENRVKIENAFAEIPEFVKVCVAKTQSS